MSNYCEACEALKTYASDFLVNGVSDKVCTSLQNNTGLNPSLAVLHKNCEDLQDTIDCLIGALGDTLPAYDVCNIKEYIDKLTTNMKIVMDTMHCSDCGQWDNIETLWNVVQNNYVELREGTDYTCEFHNNITMNEDAKVSLSVIESYDRYFFRFSAPYMQHPNFRELKQNHNYPLDLYPESLFVSINFIGKYVGINGNPLINYENNGSGILDSIPDSYRASWEAAYNMTPNYNGNYINITWRSYNDGYNTQIALAYPDTGETLELRAGVLNYEFTVLK